MNQNKLTMPKLKNLLMIMFIGLFSTNIQAQKLKYKDIFPLLDAKSYDDGIPKLQAFLSVEKNKEHANANLQMGLYFESLVNGYHLIKDSVQILSISDSAVLYLTKSKQLVTEKELKKNDDFYQSFYRRDLRTGDFGIKISDVQLDLEKKLQSLNAILKYGREIYKNLYSANAANDFSFLVYSDFSKRYTDLSELYLMAGDDQMDTLQMIVDREADMKDAFGSIRSAVSKIGKKGYSPELEFEPIETYAEDGLTEVDFFQNDVLAWEYGEWAFDVHKQIKDHVGSLKEDLVIFNQQLKDEGELLKGLEITPFENITHVIESSIVERLNALDNEPFPLTLFTVLIKKNEYDFITSSSLNPRISDEEDVDFQLAITDSLVHILNEIEKDVTLFQDEYLAEAKKKYPLLMAEYGGDFGMIKFRQQYEDFLAQSRDKWNEKNAYFTIKSKWGVSEDEMDSIYLNPSTDSSYQYMDGDKFYSVATFKDDSANTFVIGLDFKSGTKVGFMAMVSNARKIVWKENFELGKFTYSDTTSYIKGVFVGAQEGRVSAYVYSEATLENEQSNMVIVNADIVGQVKWSNELTVKNEPVEVKFNDLVKETILYMMSDDEMENMAESEIAYYVIDRSGKIR